MKTMTEKIVAIVFFLIGIGIGVLGVKFHVDSKEFMKTAVETTATITDIYVTRDSDGDANHTVYVEFAANGELYDGRLDSYHSGMYEGGFTKVYYNPENPNDFRGSSSNWAGIIMFIMGIVFAAIGGSMLVLGIKNNKKIKELKENGMVINVPIKTIKLNTSYTVNGQHPYILVASYLESATNCTYEFVSDNIWFNVSQIISVNNITTVPVYVDSIDKSKYYVDVDSLKQYLEK